MTHARIRADVRRLRRCPRRCSRGTTGRRATCRGGRPDAGPWAVLVSEFMLQQTPVARVLPVYARVAGPLADAGRAGRRLRRGRGAGVGPAGLSAPGAAPARLRRRDRATATAARCRPTSTSCWPCPASATTPRGRSRPSPSASGMPVVDTNVRRVVARRWPGRARPGRRRPRRDLAAVEALLPAAPDGRRALQRRPDGARRAGLRRAGSALRRLPARRPVRVAARPAPAVRRPARRAAGFTGTDRQVRGRLLDVLRGSPAPVGKAALDVVWADRCSANGRWTAWSPTG